MVCDPIDKTINYIEFAVSDIQRSKDFYGTVFGWTFTDYGSTYCEFNDGHMKGGFVVAPSKPGGPLIVLYGKKLELLINLIQASGGEITKNIFEFPGGKRFEFKDPDGYELAVWSEV
ncbi:MAG: VOC family protein [Methylocystaceae bacterium]|nr:VOC family protein [Methylocystaceae bacterium]